MLPRQNRLTKERDFNQTFRLGKSCFAKLLGIKAKKNNLANSRFGIVVANKVTKKATQRNKVKRQLREVIHGELKRVRPGYDFLIIALPAINDQSYEKIEKEVKNCLTKLNVF